MLILEDTIQSGSVKRFDSAFSLITLMLLLTISIVFEKTSFISTISNKVFSKSYTNF
ncbi:MAG: hypothetical protein ACQERD_12230 [Campylobacterota bacterium]